MPAAAQAAIAGNFAIECDIQLTADGEAMVHHDDETRPAQRGQRRSPDKNHRRAESRALQG